MNGVGAVVLVVSNILGWQIEPTTIYSIEPVIDLPIYCTVGDPELPTAQPYAIGRSGDQNETTNLSIVAMVDGDKLVTMGAIGFCGWSRGSGRVQCADRYGVLTVDETGVVTLQSDCCRSPLTGFRLAEHLGMVLCGRQVWWRRVTL